MKLIWKSKQQPMGGRGQGLTLVEVMIAIVVFVVGLLGLMSAISSSMVVDAVAQENNLALDGARQVIERVKSEGYMVLSGRADGNPGNSSGAGSNLGVVPETEPTPIGTEVYTHGGSGSTPASAAQESGTTVYYPTDGAGTPAAGDASGGATQESPAMTWFGTPSGTNQGTIVEVDAEGNFDVAGLQPPDDDPDGKVGHIAVTRFADDILEITVTVRWKGSRGLTEQVLRCRITDWQGSDGN